MTDSFATDMKTPRFPPSGSQLILATGNSVKLAELRRLLSDLSVHLHDMSEWPDIIPDPEDGKTLQENAIRKARAIALQTGHWSLADDTGLEVEALCGAPGVHSARYAGPDADMQMNRNLLLERMRDVALSDRAAQFTCWLALSDPNGEIEATFPGVCRGRIRTAATTKPGFGYDQLFEVQGFSVTLAELDPETTDRVSHRGQAARLLKAAWKSTDCSNEQEG